MRLFVAVWPPPEVLDVLAAMDRPAIDGVRWTAPETWHVTLRFLGEVDEASVDGLVAALATTAAGLAPVASVIGERLDAFGPSVLHVAVDGLAPWAAAIDDGLTTVLAPTERGGPFLGHVTLARGRRGRGAARGDVRPLVGRTLPTGPRTWSAGSFELVRSHLGPAGARYETVAAFPVGDHPHTNVRSQLR